MKRNKSVIPSEHGLILEALEAGANPNTINRFVSTADKYLMSDDELAATAIGLCVERHYTLDTLEYVVDNCREKTTIIGDAVQKALRTHYRQGCNTLGDSKKPFGKQVIDWAKKKEEEEKSPVESEPKKPSSKKKGKTKKIKEKPRPGPMKQMSVRFFGANDEDEDDGSMIENDSEGTDEQDIDDQPDEKEDDEQWAGMDQSCKDWWEILNYLVFYCAYGRNFKESMKPEKYHLLHAALSVSVVPPSLVQLLLMVYPEAKTELCPLYKALPIHIACTRWRYDVIRNENDASLDRVLKLMLKSDTDLIYFRHKARLPIHLALSVGQSWTFIKAFVSADKKCVGMRDPQTKFFPFQMAALPPSAKNVQLLMRSQFTPTEWRTMPSTQKKLELKRVELEQDKRQIGTIYELLRRHPNALQGKPLCREGAVKSNPLKTAGKVSILYLSFVYGRNAEGSFKLRAENVRLLRDAIMRADIPDELDGWWESMKETIWKEYHGDVPKQDEYILHAALYNPDMPPLVIELLLELYPKAVSKPVPGTTTYPLHIAAATTAYHRQQFEMPYGMDNLHLILDADKRVTRRWSHGRLPLHIALSRGKSWKEVRPLVKADPTTLMLIDQQTGLVPFQLMASFKLTSKGNAMRYSAFVEKQTRDNDISRLSTKDRALALNTIKKKQELNQLTCIFELLRHRPSAMIGRPRAHPGRDSASQLSTSLHSYSSNGNYSPHGRNADRMGDYLAAITPSRPESMRSITSKSPTNRVPFISYLKNDGSSASLITPGDSRGSLNAFLSNTDSARSLNSRDGSGIYGGYRKPNYDDDGLSSLGGASGHSSLRASGHSATSYSTDATTPTQTPGSRKGKRPPRFPINMPDLEH
jgi:hypothetical protein